MFLGAQIVNTVSEPKTQAPDVTGTEKQEVLRWRVCIPTRRSTKGSSVCPVISTKIIYSLAVSGKCQSFYISVSCYILSLIIFILYQHWGIQKYLFFSFSIWTSFTFTILLVFEIAVYWACSFCNYGSSVCFVHLYPYHMIMKYELECLIFTYVNYDFGLTAPALF